MSLGEIFSDAIKYPFSNLTNFAIVGVIALLSGFVGIVNVPNVSGIFSAILWIIGLIFTLVLSGYCIDVIKYGIENSSEFPDLDLKRNIINGIKTVIIGIVYFIIPFIIVLILAIVTGAIGVGINNLLVALGVTAIIAIIVFIIFAIFEMIALARFAESDDLGAALSVGEVVEDVKRIGIAKIIGFLIISFVILIITILIFSLLNFIPVVGIFIGVFISGTFATLFCYRSLGLLYADA